VVSNNHTILASNGNWNEKEGVAENQPEEGEKEKVQTYIIYSSCLVPYHDYSNAWKKRGGISMRNVENRSEGGRGEQRWKEEREGLPSSIWSIQLRLGTSHQCRKHCHGCKLPK
jgi:hypothetical protein